jgi:thiol-disulfide isomerase/thioredoxin
VIGVVSLLTVLAVSTVAGLLWCRSNGRMRPARTAERAGPRQSVAARSPAAQSPAAQSPNAAVLARLGVDPAVAPATLVQFSSAFCQPCRATRRILQQVVTLLPAVRHVEVDAESHLDAVRELNVLRTPTVLVVDRAGRVVRRASGQPRTADVIAAVEPYL